jgi:hypothetical protein
LPDEERCNEKLEHEVFEKIGAGILQLRRGQCPVEPTSSDSVRAQVGFLEGPISGAREEGTKRFLSGSWVFASAAFCGKDASRGKLALIL